MKIRNPNFVPAIDANAAHVKHKAAVIAALKAIPDQEMVSFTELRTALGLSKSQLPDGAIAQICQDADIKLTEG